MILIVVLIGIAAYGAYYWHHKTVTDLNSKITTLNSELAAANQNSVVNLTDATQLASTFYNAYLKSVPVSGGTTTTIQKYGTANLLFYSKYYQHGFDPIVCAQSLPTSIQATGKSTGSGIAKVSVEEIYGTSGDNAAVSVNVVNQGGLKIDSVTCPGSLGTLAAPAAGN